MWEVTLLLVSTIVTLIYFYLTWNYNYWKDRGVHGPDPRIVLGNFPSIITQKRSIAYEINDIYKAYKGKDRFVGVFMTRIPQLLIIDPELVRDVLIKNFKHFHDNDFSKLIDKNADPIFGRNPFVLTGEEWKEKRAEVTLALTASRIKASYPIILEVCSKMTKFIREKSETGKWECADAKEIAAGFTTEVVSNAIFGVEAGAFSGKECPIRDMGRTLMDQSIATFTFMFAISVFPSLKKIYNRPFVNKETSDFFVNLTQDAIKMRQDNKNDRLDFLNYLLQLQEKKNLPTIDIIAHTMTFFFDGFETSSIVISHAMHMLGRHKDVQQKLRDEIQAAYDEDGELTFDKLSELPYLDQVFNETLRMFSPLIFSLKICTEQYKFTNSNGRKLTINKDDVVMIPVTSIHYDPEYYPDPEKFNPDRFSEVNGGVKKYRDMGVFLPFMDGPRICLGMKFALAQSKAALAELVHNFEISVNKKTRDDYLFDPKNFLCAILGGIWIDLKPL